MLENEPKDITPNEESQDGDTNLTTQSQNTTTNGKKTPPNIVPALRILFDLWRPNSCNGVSHQRK